MAPTRITIRLLTSGRRSGQTRRATLYASPDGDRLVVVGSRGGAARDPAWVLNLRDEPLAVVERGSSSQRVRAREVAGDERERLWTLVTTAFPLYETDQSRTTRLIPLLEVVSAGAS